ncbi:ABC transporter permease [Micromonospora sp. WMMD967]|uniref:ABC transporter permease n=1 Tax=Micromonospora sp. WMMD967 TaxID=3016101 RepID=UPI0024170B3A|nr:ABC transporter permease [Micromonospora sp. WMMD967]MDG4835238.1 ABC transporter permease [Micromonospora sp. WMMD967]
MTAPAINGTKYPQPIDELLPAARTLTKELGEVPSRNRLMTEYRIGAPKATELRIRLVEEKAREIAARDTTTYNLVRGGTGGATDADVADAARRVAADPTASDYLRETARDVLADTAPDPLPAPVVPESTPPAAPDPAPVPEITPADPPAEVTPVSHPDTPAAPAPVRSAVVWPVVLLALPAFVAIWSGWVGLGGFTGFGIVHPLPGIWDSFSINSAITLPIGVETYGAYALYVWLSGRVPERARRFAKWSALGSLAIGALGQVAYHLLEAAGVTSAPWWITTAVACLPVAVLGMGAALAHLVRTHD